MPEKRGHFPPPVVLAMLIADGARRNPVTGKFCIHGTFDTITAPRFPCRQAVIVVYLSLTGGHGTVPVTLRLQDVDETRAPFLSRTMFSVSVTPMHGPRSRSSFTARSSRSPATTASSCAPAANCCASCA